MTISNSFIRQSISYLFIFISICPISTKEQSGFPRNHEIINADEHNINVKLTEKGHIIFHIHPPIREKLEAHLIVEPQNQDTIKFPELTPIRSHQNIYNFPLEPDESLNKTSQEKIVRFETSSTSYGRVLVYLKPINYSIYDQIDAGRAFVWVSVAKSSELVTLDQCLRYINLIFWSLSLYPQLFMNHRRKSINGLTYDYVLLTWIGSLTGLIKLLMYHFEKVQKQFADQGPYTFLESDVYDWIFASHDFILSVILFSQTVLFRKQNFTGATHSSRFTREFLDFFFYAGSYSIFAAFVGYANWILYLNLVIDFQMGSRVLRNISQACKNYERKSTTGFSFYVPLLEMVGSLALPFQLLVTLLNYNSLSYSATIFTAMLVFKFDMTLVIQHFYLYRNVSNECDEPEAEASDTEDSIRPIAQSGETPNYGIRGRAESIRDRLTKIVSGRMPFINEAPE